MEYPREVGDHDQLKMDCVQAMLHFYREPETPVPVSEILLQKSLYALDFCKMRTNLVFEGYLYGPYCRDLGEVRDNMRFNDIVTYDKHSISLLDEIGLPDMPIAELKRIHEILNSFYFDVLQCDTSLENVELYGTVMFVMDVKDIQGESVDGCPTLDCVIDGVVAWKRKKHSPLDIANAYDRIRDTIWKVRVANIEENNRKESMHKTLRELASHFQQSEPLGIP